MVAVKNKDRYNGNIWWTKNRLKKSVMLSRGWSTNFGKCYVRTNCSLSEYILNNYFKCEKII